MATYRTDTNQRLATIGQGQGGGEGRVYPVAGLPDKVAKIYHRGRVNEELYEKLRVMLLYRPPNALRPGQAGGVAWPERILFDESGPAGYLMPRVRQPQPLLEYYSYELRARHHPATTWRDLHRIGRNLCAALDSVHSGPFVIGDLNEGNALVSNDALVTLVDADSFQVLDPHTRRLFRCRVGKDEFTPPELQGLDRSQIVRVPNQDLFGLAVLLFLLLMEGFHPFGGRFVAAVSDDRPLHIQAIAGGHFAFGGDSDYLPPPLAPTFDSLNPQLQSLFQRCFVAGHTDPARRPTARQWHTALGQAEAQLARCAVAGHFYANHLRSCPWCRRDRLLRGGG